MDKKILQMKLSFPIPLNAKSCVLPGSGLKRFSRYACYEMDKTGIFMFEILEPGVQLWANTAFEGSQFYSIGVPKFYSWVNVISVYVYNDLG